MIRQRALDSGRSERSLEHYLRDIGRYPLLRREQEVELAQRIHAGDEEAVHHLVRANLRFVVTVAKQYIGQGLSLPDLINEGNYGLIKAAQRSAGYTDTAGTDVPTFDVIGFGDVMVFHGGEARSGQWLRGAQADGWIFLYEN